MAKTGRLERFLNSVGIPAGIIATVPLLAFFLISTGNLYIALMAAIGIPTVILSLIAIRIHSRTGWWFFLPLPKHLPPHEPRYVISLDYFWQTIERQLETEG